MGDMADDAAFYATVYEDQIQQEYSRRKKLEQKKANDVYEYHISGNMQHKIADMKDDYLINCYKYFRRNHEYKKAFAFYIEIRLRYPNMWRDKIGDVE